MVIACCNSNRIRQSRWRLRLAIVIVAPGRDPAIRPQRQRMPVATRYGDDASQFRRQTRFAIGVGPPGEYAAMRCESLPCTQCQADRIADHESILIRPAQVQRVDAVGDIYHPHAAANGHRGVLKKHEGIAPPLEPGNARIAVGHAESVEQRAVGPNVQSGGRAGIGSDLLRLVSADIHCAIRNARIAFQIIARHGIGVIAGVDARGRRVQVVIPSCAIHEHRRISNVAHPVR